MKLRFVGLIIFMLIVFFISFLCFTLFFDFILSRFPHMTNSINEFMKHIFFGYMAFLGGVYFFVVDKYDMAEGFNFKPKYWYIYWPVLSIAGLIYVIYKLYSLFLLLGK